MQQQHTQPTQIVEKSLSWILLHPDRLQVVMIVIVVVATIIGLVVGHPDGVLVAPAAGGGSGGNTSILSFNTPLI